MLIGIPVLRLNGDYLAIVTLAFGEIIKSIFNNLYLGVDARGLHVSLLHDKTGIGEDGKLIINGAMGISNVAPIATFTMGALLIVLTLAIVFNLVNSRAGRAIMAIRDNSIAAESVGIPVIASGGAGTREHFYDALTEGKADAALAASLFHYKELEIREVKEYLAGRNVPVRL